MIACLFTAQTSRAQIQTRRGTRGLAFSAPHFWRSYDEAIIYATDTARAQTAFENWLTAPAQAENPVKIEVEKIMSLPMHGQLLIETGFVPIDWPELSKQILADISTDGAEDLEQGNWLDVDAVAPIVAASRDIENLRRELPADISTGLNWSSARQYSFFLNVLKAPPLPVYDPETDLPVEPKEKKIVGYESEENPAAETAEADDLVLPELPPLPDRVAAVIIRARNAAVALWLWRKNSASLKLASNPILLRPIFPIFSGDT